jgi:hypothetical protein
MAEEEEEGEEVAVDSSIPGKELARRPQDFEKKGSKLSPSLHYDTAE